MTRSPRMTYVDAIRGHARYTPDAVAVIDATGETTWGQLWRAVAAVAGGLAVAGIRTGDRVVTAMTPGANHLAVLFGTMAAGAVAVPLNTRLTAAEADAFLAEIRPALAVYDETHEALARPLAPLGRYATDLVTGDTADDGDPDPDAPAMIFGTGGTTGLPKGATWSHRGLWLYAASCQANMDIRRTDVELYFSPFFHIAMVTVLFSTLYAGGAGWVLPRFSEELVLAALDTGRPTRLFGAPTALIRVIGHERFDPAQTSSVRRVLFGSTRSEPGFVTAVGTAFPRARLVTGYGATEFGAVARLRSWEFTAGLDRDLGVGRPVPGVGIEIVDDEGRALPVGQTGELMVSAPWQMIGYWGLDPAGPPPPSADPVGIRSGDLGWLDRDGYLHLAGRVKDMIITGGENVFPIEVEDVVASFPGVAEAAVFGRGDELWGERVEAAIVCRGEPAVVLEELRAYCRTRLAGYKVPSRFHLVSELPMTAAMKVDKRRLREVLEHA